MDNDAEARQAELYDWIWDGDEAEVVRRRKLLNARLRRVVDSLVIHEVGIGFDIVDKAGFEPWDPEVYEPSEAPAYNMEK